MFSVLLVEPHTDTRELYLEHLHESGLRVYVADSSDAALSLARLVDVVVTETRVPGSMDGFDLIRALRAISATRHVPILVVSADGSLVRAKAVEAGCDAFCAKPCLPEQLQVAIRLAHLQRRASAMANADLAPRTAERRTAIPRA